MKIQNIVRKSRFTEYLIRMNALSFNKWIFEPGMLFESEMKWWSDKGSRGHVHNGLDLRLYESADGRRETLGGDTKVPIVYEGRIVKVIKDFLGHSLFSAHEIYDEGLQLFTIYGHVLPIPHLSVGDLMGEGSVIASVAGRPDKGVPAHLHISVALVPKSVAPQSLTWELLDSDKAIRFLDPREIITPPNPCLPAGRSPYLKGRDTPLLR